VLEDPTEVLGCGLRWNAVYEPSPELRSQYEAFMASEGYAATAGVKASHIFASSSISASGSSASEGAYLRYRWLLTMTVDVLDSRETCCCRL
jgi:hypothetical protein